MVEPRFVARIAQVAELADALASGASSRKGVEVRVLSWAPHFQLLAATGFRPKVGPSEFGLAPTKCAARQGECSRDRQPYRFRRDALCRSARIKDVQVRSIPDVTARSLNNVWSSVKMSPL